MGIEVLTAAAVVTAGVAVYSATQKPSTPSVGSAPTPSNAKIYNDNGTVTTQTYDSATNTYTTRTVDLPESEMTEEEKAEYAAAKAEKKAKAALRTELVAKLAKGVETPTSERLAMYDKYATTLSNQMHRDVDYRFSQVQNKNRATLEATGMTGSKAYADILADEARTKALSDTDIAEKAALAKETLAANDKTYALNAYNTDINLLSNLDSGASSEAVRAAAQNRAAQDVVSATNAAQTGNYLANNNSIMANYQNQVAANAANTKLMTDTSKGLAYLYGYSTRSPVTSLTTPTSNNSPYQFMEGPGFYNMGVAT